MRLKSNSQKTRILLYTIGAGTLVLALMAFSGVCWCVFSVCGDSESGVLVEYWELFGLATVTLMGTFIFRSVRRRRADSHPASPSFPEPPDVSNERSETGNWRDLYDQLSPEERQEMKQLLNKYCAPSCSDETCGDSCAHPTSSSSGLDPIPTSAPFPSE
jgi:hypothetical protein